MWGRSAGVLVAYVLHFVVITVHGNETRIIDVRNITDTSDRTRYTATIASVVLFAMFGLIVFTISRKRGTVQSFSYEAQSSESGGRPEIEQPRENPANRDRIDMVVDEAIDQHRQGSVIVLGRKHGTRIGSVALATPSVADSPSFSISTPVALRGGQELLSDGEDGITTYMANKWTKTGREYWGTLSLSALSANPTTPLPLGRRSGTGAGIGRALDEAYDVNYDDEYDSDVAL